MFVDTKIVGPAGEDAGLLEAGELVVRGPNVMAGYWDRPEETAEVLAPDGWLRTGDAARSDKDGYIWIVGRVTDSFLPAPGCASRRCGAGPAWSPSGRRGRSRGGNRSWGRTSTDRSGSRGARR
jgi:hypothetical protein